MAKKVTNEEVPSTDAAVSQPEKSADLSSEPTAQPASSQAAPAGSPSEASPPPKRFFDMPSWAIVLVASAGFLLMMSGLLAAVGVFKALTHTSRQQPTINSTERSLRSGDGWSTGYRGWIRGGDGTDDSSDKTVVGGVVTAVDSSTITVAGEGSTTKVTVNDDTTYRGSSKPAAVNDTIRVVGTKSGDTVTATTVYLSRR